MMTARSYLLARQHERDLYASQQSRRTSAPANQSSGGGASHRRKDERQQGHATTSASRNVSVTPPGSAASSPPTTPLMARRKDAPRGLAPSSPPRSATVAVARPTTPTSPVQIPGKSSSRQHRESNSHAHHSSTKHHHHSSSRSSAGAGGSGRRGMRPKDVYSPPGAGDAIPASVAALLAVTSIPPRNRPAPRSTPTPKVVEDGCMTVDRIIEQSQESEKELSLTLGGVQLQKDRRHPNAMEILLSPPDEEDSDADVDADVDEDACSISVSVSDSGGYCGTESLLSTRTVSLESMPSLHGCDSLTTTDGDDMTLSSLSSPPTPLSTPSHHHHRHLAATAARRRFQAGKGGGSLSRSSAARRHPTRRGLEPVSSPPGEREEHPLSESDFDADLDDALADYFRRHPQSATPPSEKESSHGTGADEESDGSRAAFTPVATPATSTDPFRQVTSAFKSNLTASIRALRHAAARSISALPTLHSAMPTSAALIPPHDLLTRSILTIDPRVPFTDERRPPILVEGEEPSPAMRRYLNPTRSPAGASATTMRSTNAGSSSRGGSLDSHQLPALLPSPLTPSLSPAPVSTSELARTYTASIQMQTYRVVRPSPTAKRSRPSGSRTGEPESRQAVPASAPGAPSQHQQQRHQRQPQHQQQQQFAPSVGGQPLPPAFLVPGRHVREVRENPDFIRVAVLETAMRRARKFADSSPGRARWLLPPREINTRQYDVTADGVPVRWVGVLVDGGDDG